MVAKAQLDDEVPQQIACGRFKNATLEGITFNSCFPSQTARSDSPSTTFKEFDDLVQFVSFLFNKKILFLPINVAKNFPKLLVYHAAYLSIDTIKKIHFEGMNKLRWLFLDGNSIERVDSDTFEDLIDLIRLEMSMTESRCCFLNFFTFLVVVEENSIKLMNSDAFNKLTDLAYLHLSGNECIDEDFEGPRMQLAAQKVQEKCGFREGNRTENFFAFDCGKVSFNQGFVIGGEKVLRGQWPFVAALRYIKSKEFFCGGVLITKRHVVTGIE